MKNSKRIIAIVMVMVLMFALSASAFATNTITLKIKINGTVTETVNRNYSAGDTVYDVVNAYLGSRATWINNIPLGNNPNEYAQILRKVDTYDHVTYESPYFDEYDVYVYGFDTVLDRFNTEYSGQPYNGIYMWAEDGFAIMNNMRYMLYISSDWTYTVDGVMPDDGNGYQYYMNEYVIDSNDSEIMLIYDFYGTIVDTAA